MLTWAVPQYRSAQLSEMCQKAVLIRILTSCAEGRHNIPPHLLTLKMVSESHVTWATSMPILVFLGLSVLDLGPMYATDRQTSDRQTSDSIIA